MEALWSSRNYIREVATMPEGVMYLYHGEIQTVYFAHPQAKLPLQLTNGEIKLITWGRQQNHAGQLPLGGWAKLTAIKQGKWDQHFPKPVKLPLLKFMEKDFSGNTHWFDITKGHWVQGLFAQEGPEQRVYIVTIIPELPNIPYDRWPRILV